MKHTSKKQTQQSSGDEQQAGGIMDYWRMVANNRPFMLLLVGEVCTPFKRCLHRFRASIHVGSFDNDRRLGFANDTLSRSRWLLCKSLDRLFVQIFSQTGNEVNYIATMSLVHRLSGGSAMLIGFVVIIRVLPILFLFPIAGVVADKWRRRRQTFTFQQL